MEFWGIFHEFFGGVSAFRPGTISSPGRPSIPTFVIEILATLLITCGVFGEFWVGAKVSSISAQLRSKGHELEAIATKESDELKQQAAKLNKEAADTRERASKGEREAGMARKDAADAILLAKRYESGIAEANARGA